MGVRLEGGSQQAEAVHSAVNAHIWSWFGTIEKSHMEEVVPRCEISLREGTVCHFNYF
jgi:hypothetical protein